VLFNSIEFFLFLPVVFALYWFVCNKSLRLQNALVLVASYFFYAWWSWKFLCLLLLSTALDYFYGFWVASTNRKRAKLFLWLSILNNLLILGIFKYYNFFAAQLQECFELFGMHMNPILLHVALPIGISFYTFHGMSYVFDIYRGQRSPVNNIVDYSVFVSFFPLLVAGPIERANHLLPQIQKSRIFKYEQAIEGGKLILWGLFKKVVIADSLAGLADEVFQHYSNHNAATLIVGAIAFSFQIYGDFSGYSDIAIGTAKLFGFELLSNFKFPYFSRNIAEFWRRWHISLSSWFRDYVYIPLGGSKLGKRKTFRNVLIIFLVSGFWHGASWNFIIWGFIHACGFLTLQLVNINQKNLTEIVAEKSSLPSLKEIRQMTLTFFFVTFAWIFFRASSVQIAFDYIYKIGQSLVQAPNEILNAPGGKIALIYILPLLLGDWHFRRDERNLKMRAVLAYILFFIILDFGLGEEKSFIYFAF
jgi:D-alanyl-lipoteichoic acid acyltransferase DltB (MBOAT superfamily)